MHRPWHRNDSLGDTLVRLGNTLLLEEAMLKENPRGLKNPWTEKAPGASWSNVQLRQVVHSMF